MDVSSDEEEIPPTPSLRFEGTAASACFLVQNSQNSPQKSLPGGFLYGLSQV
jgi:hypothetical protein